MRASEKTGLVKNSCYSEEEKRMKKILLFFMAAALVVFSASCGKKADDGVQSDSTLQPDSTEKGTFASDISENTEDSSDSAKDSGTEVPAQTPVLGAGGGEYSDDGSYTPPRKIDDDDVLYYGTYDDNDGVNVTVTDEGKEEETKPDDERVDPPKEDVYKKAVNSLGSYTAKVSFCYYVDMDDGWHESHPYSTTVKYDKASDSYVGSAVASGKEVSVYYSDGVYTAASGKTSEAPVDIFMRQCNLLTPLELDTYNFETSENVTVVSAVLNAADYKYKLMMSSNFFNGYEKDTADNITMGKLYYTAKINAAGKLIFCEYGFDFTVASTIGNENITVTVKTLYE